jgi:hypothetical protein
MVNTKLSATGEDVILLEPKDLRIGNILEYKKKPVWVTNLSLDIDDEYQDKIGFCELGKTSGEISDWNRALCGDLRPIPLTPELLEKAGFEQSNEFDDTFRLGQFDLYYGKGYCEWTVDDRGDNEGTKPRLIKYLHQLQNLFFALTGEELPVNL